MGMSASNPFRVDARVRVPRGLDEPRKAIVVEVWGDPDAPTHIRVQLDPSDPEDEEVALLLLNPSMVTAAA